MDDRRDRIEEGQRVLARPRRDPCRERTSGQRAGGDDDAAPFGRRRGDEFAYDLDQRLGIDRRRHPVRKGIAVDGQRRPGGDARGVGLSEDQRPEAPHFGVDQPDGVVVGVVAPEAVRTHEFGERVGVMGVGAVRPPHFVEHDRNPGAGALPRGFRPGEPATDDMNRRHAAPLRSGNCRRSARIVDLKAVGELAGRRNNEEERRLAGNNRSGYVIVRSVLIPDRSGCRTGNSSRCRDGEDGP